jgi:hypothetical protein
MDIQLEGSGSIKVEDASVEIGEAVFTNSWD